MSHKILLRVTAPAVVIGLLLFAACLASVGYISHLQYDLNTILSRNVASLQAAQELEIRVRQLRHHNLLYLMDPARGDLEVIATDQLEFEKALDAARGAGHADEVRAIEESYQRYKNGQAELRAGAAANRTPAYFRKLVDSHPIHQVVNRCEELVSVNKQQMAQTAQESLRVSRQASWAMLLLGLAGPVGGLATGYGVARALSQSIYRLSVRVKDLAGRLDQDVGSVSVASGGDLHSLDRQMQAIVRRVEEVTERVQQHQRDLLRTEQLAALGQLAAGVAHEVRNPLTSIKMLVEAALRPRNPTPLNDEDLRIIHREVTRLEQTVQGFLDFARLPAPRRGLCDLREVVARSCDLTRARAERQNVEVVVRAGPSRRRLRGRGAVRHRARQLAAQRPGRHAARGPAGGRAGIRGGRRRPADGHGHRGRHRGGDRGAAVHAVRHHQDDGDGPRAVAVQPHPEGARRRRHGGQPAGGWGGLRRRSAAAAARGGT